MRGKWILVSVSVILISVAAGALSVLRQQRAQPHTKTARPAAAPASVAGDVSIPGTIRARHVVPVSVQVNGAIEAFLADVGQEVYEGQLLAKISSAGLETGREMAAAAVDKAQDQVNKIQGQITSARLEASRARADAMRSRGEFERAEKLYERQKFLYSQGATPRLVYEKAGKEFETAQQEYSGLGELARQAEDRATSLAKDLEFAKRALDDKNKQLEDAAALLGAADVYSPVTGVVVERRGEPGKVLDASEQSELFQIGVDLGALQVVLEPDPAVLNRIRPGQQALIFVPELQSGAISGTVTLINSNQAIIEFTSPNPALKPGMPAQVRIRVG